MRKRTLSGEPTVLQRNTHDLAGRQCTRSQQGEFFAVETGSDPLAFTGQSAFSSSATFFS